ncbi:MAG: hypothetical protein LAO21_16540, partial [Acidobacteriia bacterium]|nr:hypothetical protein [Terriglobia bacterium]
SPVPLCYNPSWPISSLWAFKPGLIFFLGDHCTGTPRRLAFSSYLHSASPSGLGSFVWILGFGFWVLLGIWILDFGIYLDFGLWNLDFALFTRLAVHLPKWPDGRLKRSVLWRKVQILPPVKYPSRAVIPNS